MYHSEEQVVRQKMEDIRLEISTNRQQRKADRPSPRVTLWTLLLTALHLH